MPDYILTHHGIKGMRWGVRRYQNPDGSLTPAGKKRQAKQEYRQAKHDAFKRFGDASTKAESAYEKDIAKKNANQEKAYYKYENAYNKASQDYSNDLKRLKKSYKEAKANIKAEKRDSIRRGEELHKKLTDPSQIRWNEDRNNRLINKLMESRY